MSNRPEIRAVIGNILSQTRLTGGDINDVVHLRSENGDFVLKTNNNPPPGLFASEAAGLALLQKYGLRVPEVYLAGDDFLLMQYFAPGAAQPKLTGELLARLHAEPQVNYGFDKSTYLATLLQENKPQAKWSVFYFESRIQPLLGTGPEIEMEKWKKFYEIVAPLLDACPHSSLLHGDLWAGNLYHAKAGPVFIDPAVYYGDALVDIAMTKLFSGFGPQFYEAYFANTLRRSDVNELLKIYQVYPLLVHARLFGCQLRGSQHIGGGYYHTAASIRDSFI